MSSGPSDAAAEDRLADDVWREAFTLLKATTRLGKAVQRARMGHRGWSIAREFIVREVNIALHKTGFRLVDEEPGKTFEHYPGAYDP